MGAPRSSWSAPTPPSGSSARSTTAAPTPRSAWTPSPTSRLPEPRTCCSGRNTKSGKPQYVAAFLVACSAAGPDGTPAGRTVAGRIGRRNTPFDVSTTSVTDGSRTVGRLADVVVSKRPRRGVCSASEKRLDSDENFLNRPKHPIEIRQHQLPTDCGGRRPIHDSHRRRYGEDHFSGTGTIKP